MHEDCEEEEEEKRRRWKERTPHPVVDDKTLFLYSPFSSNPSFSPPALQVFLLLNKRLYTRGEQIEVILSLLHSIIETNIVKRGYSARP